MTMYLRYTVSTAVCHSQPRSKQCYQDLKDVHSEVYLICKVIDGATTFAEEVQSRVALQHKASSAVE